MDKLMRMYLNPKHPGSLGGVDRFLRSTGNLKRRQSTGSPGEPGRILGEQGTPQTVPEKPNTSNQSATAIPNGSG